MRGYSYIIELNKPYSRCATQALISASRRRERSLRSLARGGAMNKNRACVKRLAIKRQLRKSGVAIPATILLNLRALRALRRIKHDQAATIPTPSRPYRYRAL